MNRSEIDLECNERREEYFALINMIGYAMGIAESLGASSAASHIEAARQALVSDVQSELSGILSKDGVIQLSTLRAGHC
ncbi:MULTISPECIES: hypothetical protein [unclassified Rhizobium]|jgi:hypothetical protein|uniref:hypothetical protein n=1 Tax=unclassified Rhizobium TaxID=2613769 RepID=UPI003D2D5CB3